MFYKITLASLLCFLSACGEEENKTPLPQLTTSEVSELCRDFSVDIAAASYKMNCLLYADDCAQCLEGYDEESEVDRLCANHLIMGVNPYRCRVPVNLFLRCLEGRWRFTTLEIERTSCESREMFKMGIEATSLSNACTNLPLECYQPLYPSQTLGL